MALDVVGISEIKISDNIEDTLITYSLGSCIGVAIYDPIARVAGMIHYMLPNSKIALAKAESRPGMFADTGIPLLFKMLYDNGASKENLIVKVAGGAKMMDPKNVFNIGERNFLILRKLLWKNNVLIKSQDIGESLSRTLRLYVGSGRVTVKSANEEIEI